VNESASIRFKRRLRQLREWHGWTQEKAAETCGIGYKLYQLYELGIKRNPGLLTLEKIAAGYSLDISELLAPRFIKLSRQIKAKKQRRAKTRRPR
jgi:transcriptional regulator with XRE-family HTH domain